MTRATGIPLDKNPRIEWKSNMPSLVVSQGFSKSAARLHKITCKDEHVYNFTLQYEGGF